MHLLSFCCSWSSHLSCALLLQDTNSALHYYSPYNANTTKGVLSITTERKVNAYRAFNEKTKEFYLDKKHIQTGMVQSWNKFCIVGGIVEFSARLPGDPQVGGLWPALWMLGNLARATYVGSSNFMWPYSYNKCDDANRVSQEISACSKVNHYNMESYRGRGAPEIDVIESMQGETGKLPSTFIQRPYQSASLQIAPGIENKRPNMGSRPHPDHWYTDLEYGNSSPVDLNPFFYGVTLEHKPRSHTYQADAVSANLQLNDTHYEDQHIYRVEWEPPAEDGTGGYVRWYTDDEFVFGLTGDSLDITGTEIPSEPMYLIMNTAVSSNWGFPAPCPEGCDCKCFECGNPDCSCAIPDGYCENLPSSFEIDYVRVYQAVDDPKHILGCSPESRPTEVFIQGHLDRYKTNGQSKALQPVVSGGADCDRDRDCGGHERGHCDTSGACQCSKYFTGPKCLAHNGFYDVDTGRPPQTLPRKYGRPGEKLKLECSGMFSHCVRCVQWTI
jgi:beta-glucanase (GH16 family)